SFSAFTRFSSCGMVTSTKIARRTDRSISTISGLLATIVLSVMIDRSVRRAILDIVLFMIDPLRSLKQGFPHGS
ncbi:hypothetical protein ACDT19_14075, partial [Staphylococcus aureus]